MQQTCSRGWRGLSPSITLHHSILADGHIWLITCEQLVLNSLKFISWIWRGNINGSSILFSIHRIWHGDFFYSFTLLYSLFLTIIFGVYSLLLFHMPMSLIRSLLQKFADNLGLPYKFF